MILLALLEERARHGYELAKLIEAQSEQQLQFHVASLYPMLYRLERKGLVEGKWVEKAGERRKRYLQADGRGAEIAGGTAQVVARVCAGVESAHGVQPCLIGASWCANGFRRCTCGRSGRTRLSRNWRCNWNRPTRMRLRAAPARRRRGGARWGRWAIGTSWGAVSMCPKRRRRIHRGRAARSALRTAFLPAQSGVHGDRDLDAGLRHRRATRRSSRWWMRWCCARCRITAPERLMAIETRKAQQPEIEPWTSALDFFDIPGTVAGVFERWPVSAPCGMW